MVAESVREEITITGWVGEKHLKKRNAKTRRGRVTART